MSRNAPSKAQVEQWNDKAMQLMKRHDQNGDGLLDPREMASAINELCGTHGLSARTLSGALGIEAKLENSSYRWSPIEFQELFRKAMLMADGGEGGANSADKLLDKAVDTLRDLDAKTEASLKQCYNNYCRLVVGPSSKMMMDGDLRINSAQWMQLCADIGVAQPVGPVSHQDLSNIYSAAAGRSSGLALKQFLTALAMITPNLTTLCSHMVSQLGPQMRPRAGNDAPQPATFPMRNLDLNSRQQNAQAHWGAAQAVMSAANAFMRVGGGGHAGNSAGSSPKNGMGGGQNGMGGGGGNGMHNLMQQMQQQQGGMQPGMMYQVEETITTRQGSGFNSPASGTARRGSQEQLAPLQGGPITARLGGGVAKQRSSLTAVGLAGTNGYSNAGTGAANGRPNSLGGGRMEDMPSNSLLLLDRLAAAEARIAQLEQQQAFAREMMAAGGMAGRAGGGGGGGGNDHSSGTGLGTPQMMAMEAKIAALESELSRLAPGANLPRVQSELRDALDLMQGKLDLFSKDVQKLTTKVERAEETVRSNDDTVRSMQGPLQEATANMNSLRSTADQLKAAAGKQETEILTQIVARLTAAESSLENLDSQVRRMVREGRVAVALPSKEHALAAAEAAAAAPAAPGTPTAAGAAPAAPTPASVAAGAAAAAAAGAPKNANGDYMVQTLGVVQLDSEEEVRLQIKLLCEAMDNLKRRMNQLSGSHLNPIDFPTRAELAEVKKVILGDINDIDVKYVKLQKEVAGMSLKMPVLEKKVESSALGGGTEVVNRLVGMGMARMVDVKDAENYMTERQGGVAKQFDNLRRDMNDVQKDLQGNMEKLVGQFNQINKQLQEARRDANAPAVAMMAAAQAGNGGGGGVSASTAATAASAAATAAQTASDAKSAVDRERMDRERETRELRERLARAESHLGGALGELQQVVGVELSTIKEVLAQLEAAMGQADAESMRCIRELDATVKGALSSFEKASHDQSDMTGKVIMKMARQITDIQVKLKELAAACASGGGGGHGGHSGHSASHHTQQQHQQQQQQLPPVSPHTSGDIPGLGKEMFASKLLASQDPGSPHGAQQQQGRGNPGGARTSSSGAANGSLLDPRKGNSLAAETIAMLAEGRHSQSGIPILPSGMPGRAGMSPARGMLAADPPPPPGRMPRNSDAGGGGKKV